MRKILQEILGSQTIAEAILQTHLQQLISKDMIKLPKHFLLALTGIPVFLFAAFLIVEVMKTCSKL